MTCRELVSFLMDYLDGGLSVRQRAVFEGHLRVCPECREYLAAYRATVERSREAFCEDSDAIPLDIPEDLVRALLDSRGLRSSSPSHAHAVAPRNSSR